MFGESHDVDIVHQHDSDDGGKAREAPWVRHSPLQQCQQQVGDERHPYLYLDGVGTFAVEVSEWEVLLQLFEGFM